MLYRGARHLCCDSALGTDAGTVPAGATVAKVILAAGVQESFILSVL